MAAAVRLVDDGLKARNTAPPAIKPYKPVCAANNAAYAAANVQAASRSVCDALAAAGVALVHDFISADEEAALLETVDGGAWEGTLSRAAALRPPPLTSKTCAPVDRPLPPMFRAVCGRLPRRPWANDGAAQVTVNEYEPGQGISPHVDAHGAFADGLYSLTLGAGVAMRLKKNRRADPDAPTHALWLPPRSLLCLGERAYAHGASRAAAQRRRRLGAARAAREPHVPRVAAAGALRLRLPDSRR
ncbi:hypothetical protein JL722_3943 [Aureococcus anophagefferens]|nr:hypothetical protein JL722_3943 [Aureococcus anophagefferens]